MEELAALPGGIGGGNVVLLLLSDSLMVQVSEMISEKTWVSLLVKFAVEV